MAPYHILTSNSLDDLNERIAEKYDEPPVVDAKQFRPNIVVEGRDAYDEDKWKRVYIGDSVELLRIRKTDRLVLLTLLV